MAMQLVALECGLAADAHALFEHVVAVEDKGLRARFLHRLAPRASMVEATPSPGVTTP